jgi:hypothetical protein
MTDELEMCPFCGKSQIEAPESCVCESETLMRMSRKEWQHRPIEDELRAEISALQAQTRWIPVSERLPEKNYADLGDDLIVYLDHPYNRAASMKYDDGVFYSGGWGGPATNWTDHVTHWMQLPIPPLDGE